MLKTVITASVLALAAGAQAAPFTLTGYQGYNGNTSYTNIGLTVGGVQGAGFYNRQGGTNANPLASDPFTWAETATNHSAYDSYLTLSSDGPSRLAEADEAGDSLSAQIRSFYGYSDSFQASGGIVGPGTHIGGTGDNDGQMPSTVMANTFNQVRGGFGADAGAGTPSISSDVNPASGFEGIFLGQLTVNRGATLSGAFDFTVLRAQGQDSKIDLALNGASALAETAPGVFQPLVFKSYLVAGLDNLSHSRSGGNRGTGTGSSQRFGDADVYHIWVEVVPTPGAAALAGLAAVAGVRRRRLA